MPEDVVAAALLIVSELVTNAVTHARPAPPGPARCSLSLWLIDNDVIVGVYDTDRRPPILRTVSPETEGGRGLLLVDAHSRTWGYTYTSPVEKLVWARLPLHTPAATPHAGPIQRTTRADSHNPAKNTEATRPNGAAIRALRLARGMSLRDVHVLTGLDRGYLSRLERGLAGAKPDTVARCANALDVPVAAITHGP